MDSTVAAPVKVYAGWVSRGVKGQGGVVLCHPTVVPPLHAAPVGGGGHLELAVGRQGGPDRQAVQAHRTGLGQTVLGQLAGRPDPARLLSPLVAAVQ